MLTQTLRTIIERATGDDAFREQLLTKPDEALAGYSLSTDEAGQIRAVSRADLEKFAKDLSVLDGELTDDALHFVIGAQQNQQIHASNAKVCA